MQPAMQMAWGSPEPGGAETQAALVLSQVKESFEQVSLHCASEAEPGVPSGAMTQLSVFGSHLYCWAGFLQPVSQADCDLKAPSPTPATVQV